MVCLRPHPKHSDQLYAARLQHKFYWLAYKLAVELNYQCLIDNHCLLLNLSYEGGGGLKVSPLFLFVKTIEKVIRLCTVLKKKLFDWQF